MVSPGYWEEKKNHIYYISWFLKRYNIKHYEHCYNIRYDDICSNGGSGLLNLHHECSVYILLKNTLIYKWLPWKFTNCPNNFWNNKKNIIWYLKWLFEKLEYTTKEDYYKLNKHDFKENYGCGLLGKYSGKILNILLDAFPSNEWDFWKFGQSPKKYWYKKKNQRKFMDSFHDSIQIKTQENMYYILIEEINNYGGTTLTNTIYKGNRYDLYSSIYPEFLWEEDKFFKKYQLCGNNNCNHKFIIQEGRGISNLTKEESRFLQNLYTVSILITNN
jgi:hypothetical protein